VSEGGLWRDVEHGTGGLLELEVGEVEVEERERERESSGTQSQCPFGACKERQGNNAAAS
jgi:hypothetical protein